MGANETTGREERDVVSNQKSEKSRLSLNRVELDESGTSGAQGPAHAVDPLDCPTLFEQVVDFLERYSWAPYGLR